VYILLLGGKRVCGMIRILFRKDSWWEIIASDRYDGQLIMLDMAVSIDDIIISKSSR
jgi:hypothetical protein